jgi:hypothetical protein
MVIVYIIIIYVAKGFTDKVSRVLVNYRMHDCAQNHSLHTTRKLNLYKKKLNDIKILDFNQLFLNLNF